MKPTVIRLTDDVRARILALVGKSGMAGFIRQAVEAELQRRDGVSAKSSNGENPPLDRSAS